MRPPRGAPGGRPKPQEKGELRGRLSLARALSKFGVCSRKQAEQLIAEGRVKVGGVAVVWPARRIDPRTDVVTVDGRRVQDLAETTVIALHKPRGYVTTRSEPGGRRTVYELLEGVSRWLFPVGRLDRDSSGLLIFTNDHRLGEQLTNPDSHVSKTYHVRVRGLPEREVLQVLRDGVRLEDRSVTRRAQVRILGSPAGDSSWLERLSSCSAMPTRL